MTRAPVLVLVLACGPAHASAPTPLDEGQPAPFAGLLLDHGHAATLLRAEAQRDRLRGELRGTRARLVRTEADLVAERQARQVDRDEAAERERAQADALDRAERLAREAVRPPAWYERPAFLISTTAALTLAATLTIIFATR